MEKRMDPIKNEDADSPEVAWAAGIFEGEGTFKITRGSDGFPRFVGLVIEMTDEDVIRRVHGVLGGYINGPYNYVSSKFPNAKTSWKWQIHTAAEVDKAIRLLLPWLGDRRRTRAHEALLLLADVLSAKHRQLPEHCKRGHPFTEENTYRYDGYRACRACRAEAARRSRAGQLKQQ
jgi:hypothetical protein